jgi:hypothetical protein
MATDSGTEAARPLVRREGRERRPAGDVEPYAMIDPIRGPFYSTGGPNPGPIRLVDCPRTSLDIFGERGVIGQAEARSSRPGPRGAIALFTLWIRGERLEGQWECVGRRFVPAAGEPALYGIAGPPADEG